MSGEIFNIEAETENNSFFRKVLFTGPNSQLVVMSLKPGEDIGMEVHEVDQFIRIEIGDGVAILDNAENKIADGDAVVIPAGTHHNIINTGETAMKLYTIYSPAEHPAGTIQEVKEEAPTEEVEQ